jgi:hypothetical protein
MGRLRRDAVEFALPTDGGLRVRLFSLRVFFAKSVCTPQNGPPYKSGFGEVLSDMSQPQQSVNERIDFLPMHPDKSMISQPATTNRNAPITARLLTVRPNQSNLHPTKPPRPVWSGLVFLGVL